MTNFNARDLIALIALCICAVLLLSGINGEVKALMGMILGYYFRGSEKYLIQKSDYEKRN